MCLVQKLVLQSIIFVNAASSPPMPNPIHWFSFTLSDPTCCIAVISQRITRDLTGESQRLSRLSILWVRLDEINTFDTCRDRNQFKYLLHLFISVNLLKTSHMIQQPAAVWELQRTWLMLKQNSSVLSLTHTPHCIMRPHTGRIYILVMGWGYFP